MNIPDYIKPGAFVCLRDGSKAEIYSTDNGGIYPVHGRIFKLNGTAWADSWTANSRCDGELRESPLDIIGPWVERPDYSKLWPILPPWIKWLARDADGELFGYTEKPNLGSTGWCGAYGSCNYIWIPHDYRPEPVGDWKDSLQERPTL